MINRGPVQGCAQNQLSIATQWHFARSRSGSLGVALQGARFAWRGSPWRRFTLQEVEQTISNYLSQRGTRQCTTSQCSSTNITSAFTLLWRCFEGLALLKSIPDVSPDDLHYCAVLSLYHSGDAIT